MKKIGFSNFRRFEHFPLMEYGPITFLVGKNNSGKSTFVKAVLLINNYLKSNDIYQLSLDDKILESTNIVTFGRAKNINIINNDAIQFEYQIKGVDVKIIITGDQDDTKTRVVSLDITDSENGFKFEIQPHTGVTVTINKTEVTTEATSDFNKDILNFEKLRALIKKNLSELQNNKSSREYLELIDKLNQINDKEHLTQSEVSSNTNGYSTEVSIDYSGKGLYDLIGEIVRDVEINYRDVLANSDIEGEERDFYLEYKYAYQDRVKLEKSFKSVVSQLNKTNVIYLGSYSIKQKALFFIQDTLNPLAQVIHEYKQLGIEVRPGSIAYNFARMWIKEFEIGSDFKIIMHAGEAYEVLLLSDGKDVQLADKGMGSVQAMLLILRLACIIEKYETRFEDITIIIEEPEINLHPALQSKIADMLLFVYELKQKKRINCSIEFIIETHSEYLIRKTQVMVAQNEFENDINDNPFYVYYFPHETSQMPYRMMYNQDGSFKNNFGAGFFDEASSATLELLKLKRQKKA